MLGDYTLFEFVRLQFLGEKNEVDQTYRHMRIESAMARVANKERCADMLMKTCEPYISSYDYQELSFLYQQVAKLSISIDCKNSLLVLEIITDYNRLNSPDQKELHKIKKSPKVILFDVSY
jgi:hypothetical protein